MCCAGRERSRPISGRLSQTRTACLNVEGLAADGEQLLSRVARELDALIARRGRRGAFMTGRARHPSAKKFATGRSDGCADMAPAIVDNHGPGRNWRDTEKPMRGLGPSRDRCAVKTVRPGPPTSLSLSMKPKEFLSLHFLWASQP